MTKLERREQHDHGAGKHDRREQEVRDDEIRVQVEADRQVAERRLGERAQEDGEREPAGEARQAADPERAQRGDQRERDRDPADQPVAELDVGVVALFGERLARLAAGPVLAAEAGPGQPDGRPRDQDQIEAQGRAGRKQDIEARADGDRP